MNLIHENKNRKLSILPLSILLSLYGVSTSLSANVIADNEAPSHQQADIKTEVHLPDNPTPCRNAWGCGKTTTVNIQSPDKNGLSHNKYTQFDAGHYNDVIIINNALSNEIDGNRNLESMAAKIILNEVRSPYSSTFAGEVKLAGQNAHVIIANPSGINCYGCSFTDIPHLTLTTGKPSFSENKLSSFRVVEGEINIHKGGKRKGLQHKGKGSDIAYLDLFSEKLNVTGHLGAVGKVGEVGADDVMVVAGKYRIDLAAPGQKLNIKPLSSHLSRPDYFDSVDVGKMGGMYANKIRIVAEGNIKNSNDIVVLDSLLAITHGNINNNGLVLGKDVYLHGGGVIDNSNGRVIGEDGDKESIVTVSAGRLINDGGDISADSGDVKVFVKKVEVANQNNNPFKRADKEEI
ncbi:Large exoprotein involved in heme utilization or adhesion [Yersinia frederiksenii]|uniref:two-partner secretion domain-containing protein n=1 Tax=Yersinia frederiksenii TaxID=29484 RepID=UPI0005DB5562|nr:filamentous hemagglutinin N-terminal domain-containing protein [Yersinia frederiksenii]CNC70491.1 Large exoprotein involved in heme utilization or adhesion [Yersinia frederiksenii]